MSSYLSDDVKITRVIDALADGQGTTTSSNVDMAGYDGVVFVCLIGDVTATGTVTMTATQAATDTTGDALSGMSAAADSDDDDLLLAIDIQKPADRYLGVSLVRAVANSVVGGVIALQYKARSLPVTQPTTAGFAATVVQGATPDEA